MMTLKEVNMIENKKINERVKKPELIRHNKNIYFIILAILCLILIFGFYWYELRPAQIRKECVETGFKVVKDKEFWSDTYKIIYDICLSNHGLKK